MFGKFCKSIIILALAGIISWFALRVAITVKAENKAATIIAESEKKLRPKASENTKVVAISKTIFSRFKNIDPSNVLLYKFRPYVTNKRLPDFIRLQDGVLETLLERGMCDNASRMLAFILAQKNIKSVQWNMVSDKNAHSIRLVHLSNGKNIFIDPYYGLSSKNEAAAKRIKNGKLKIESFNKFSDKSVIDFYTNQEQIFMAAEGQPLIISAKVAKSEKTLILGSPDGKDRDVKAAAGHNSMTPFWHYVGHKYNREWVRVLKTDHPVRVTMTLIEPAEDGVITSTPLPKIDGKTLQWDMDAGDEIRFEDGLAKISLKRFNSYIGVDQIEINPL